MLFSSPIFLFLFLPLTLLAHFVAPRVVKNLVLLVASLLFYAWGEFEYTKLMLVVIAMNYGFGLWIEPCRQRVSGPWILALAVAANLAILAYFKYANFAIANWNFLLNAWGQGPIWYKEILLPIGISFYTFQAMSYVIDVYRGETAAQRNPIDLALYVALFPQLIAGPIVRYVDVAAEIRTRRVDWTRFADGVQRFSIGLGKKMLLANTLATVADSVFDIPNGQIPAATAWLGIVCYAMQIYFDFSGYSDMAIGLGHMFGFTFLENFNYPYIAESLSDFWRRWHISLSTWFCDYVYIPLGGNRRGPLRTAFNLLTVFVLCGLWHGASWNFLVWGLFHGTFLTAERWGLSRILDRLPRIARRTYLLAVVLLGWVLFRANDLGHALTYLQSMFGFGHVSSDEFSVAMFLDSGLVLALVVGTLACCPLPALLVRSFAGKSASLPTETPRRWLSETLWGIGRVATVSMLLLASAALMRAATHNPFIYFRF